MNELSWYVTLILSIEASFGMGLYYGWIFTRSNVRGNKK